jgi:hypothetical protein
MTASTKSGLFVILLALTFGCGNQAKHESDDYLISNFKDHKKVFEQLRQMAQADTNLVRVSMQYTVPEDPETARVSRDRIAEYRKLFRRARCPVGLLSSTNRPGIWFLASAHGLLNRGSSKGYCYATRVPAVIVSNTASYRPPNAEGFEVYRHIEGSWYLIFERGN